jgi:hypothetical protein
MPDPSRHRNRRSRRSRRRHCPRGDSRSLRPPGDRTTPCRTARRWAQQRTASRRSGWLGGTRPTLIAHAARTAPIGRAQDLRQESQGRRSHDLRLPGGRWLFARGAENPAAGPGVLFESVPTTTQKAGVFTNGVPHARTVGRQMSFVLEGGRVARPPRLRLPGSHSGKLGGQNSRGPERDP